MIGGLSVTPRAWQICDGEIICSHPTRRKDAVMSRPVVVFSIAKSTKHAYVLSSSP